MGVQAGKHSQQMCPWPYVTGTFARGTIIISTATVLVRFGHVQRVGVGMYISLRVTGLETAVGYEDTAAATATYSLPACNHEGGDSSVWGIQGTHSAILN